MLVIHSEEVVLFVGDLNAKWQLTVMKVFRKFSEISLFFLKKKSLHFRAILKLAVGY